jgi:hypothetical protein
MRVTKEDGLKGVLFYDLCLGTVLLRSEFEHQLSWVSFMISLDPKCLGYASN